MRMRRKHSGQSLVEFVLIFPIFLFLILGFLDLGRAIFYYSSLSNAVREATRAAIVNKTALDEAASNPTNNSLQDLVMDYAIGLTQTNDPLTKADITVTLAPKVNDFYTTVSIEALYNFQPITPGISLILGSSGGINLRAQSTMQVTPGSR